jgi:S1-C subfamily serine protease
MRRAVIALLAASAAATPAAAAPIELTGDALDRGSLLAQPSVYRVEASFRLRGATTATGRPVPLPRRARTVRIAGVAFGVAPGGYLVTAAHVVRPDGATLAARAAEQAAPPRGRDGAGGPAAGTELRPVGTPLALLGVRQHAPGEEGSRAWRARVVAVDPVRDLALLKIPAPAAPSLLIAGTVPAAGLRLATFRTDADGRVAVVHGRAGDTQLFSRLGREGTRLRADLRPGDSGTPAVDALGRVRGVLVARLPDAGAGVLEPVWSVRRLLGEAGVRNLEGPAAGRFRRAMDALWRLDPAAARRGLLATLAAYRNHALAERELETVRRIASADFRIAGPSRTRGALLAGGATAAAVAAACGLALLRRPRPEGPRIHAGGAENGAA